MDDRVVLEPGSGQTFRGGSRNGPNHAAYAFYLALRKEVIEGNSQLGSAEQRVLQSHYPVMMTPERNPPRLAAAIYAERRQYPVAAILATSKPVVLDAGCGYGSESYLFASLGARVIGVDADPDKIRIARLRQAYYEAYFHCPLDIAFEVADLDEYVPGTGVLSLIWLASVLAAVRDQEEFLKRTFEHTRAGGRVMITDMNLWNPLFLYGEWRRRERAKRVNPEFSRAAGFRAMFERRERRGARYYDGNGTSFDDVQFFTPLTLRHLLRAAGFRPGRFHFSGFVPPAAARLGLTALEPFCARIPLLSQLGYFYLGIGVKE